MKKIIVTFGVGEHAEYLKISLPRFAVYATTHGYGLFAPHPEAVVRGVHSSIPPSWMKLSYISPLCIDYDVVLWIDADVVILDMSEDILDYSSALMNTVVHQTSDGRVPNCGVWLVDQRHGDAQGFLDGMMKQPQFRRSDGWWEQAAFIAMLGQDPDQTPVKSITDPRFGELPYEFNTHPRDPRGVQSAKFFHATQYPDRRAAMLAAARS